MSVSREALDFYADDELAIMREETINRLYGRRRINRRARADLKADLSLIGHELETRRSAAQAHRQLIVDLCEERELSLEDIAA